MANILNVVLYIAVGLLLFGVLIFVHELGHFMAAKKAGIKVNEFALGMGPTLLKKKKGETTYALRLLPIGGFVSMEGEDEESSDNRSFQRASVPSRLLVTVAGAAMNLVLGFIVLVFLVALGGPIASRTVSVVYTEDHALQVGDVITHINGRRAYIMNDLSYEFLRTQNGTFSFTVRRDGEKVQLENVEFAVMSETLDNGEEYEWLDIGFAVQPTGKNVLTVAREAFMSTLSYARLILLSVSDLLFGRAAINQLSGPVGIISGMGAVINIGWEAVFNMMALLAVNLGIMNMLPFPALDGGRAVLLVIEAIRRKPLKQKYEIALNLVGFVLLMGLMVVVSVNDISRLIG